MDKTLRPEFYKNPKKIKPWVNQLLILHDRMLLFKGLELPQPGGLLDQDELLMQALTEIRKAYYAKEKEEVDQVQAQTQRDIRVARETQSAGVRR